MKKIFASTYFLFLSLLQINCEAQLYENTQHEQSIYDRVARQLAGFYIPDELLNNAVYIDYVESINERWKNLNETSLSKIKDWSEKNITPHIGDTKVLFYPFGGPDIAYAVKFFPQMQLYILVGLEPIGSFDSIRKNIENESTLLALKQAFSSYLQKGYFVTSEMVTQLSNRHIRGAIYLILFELIESGFYINSIKDISINSDGQETFRKKGAIDGIKIICTQDGVSKEVLYIRADLSNSNKKLTHLIKFIKPLQFSTLLKSASYALHDRFFSKIRDFILNNACSVLQDDTGIPFYKFDRMWDKYIFGQYTHPTLSIFESYKQPDLTRYYASNTSVSIPFKIGYGFNQDRPNLFLAVPVSKKTVKSTNEVSGAASKE